MSIRNFASTALAGMVLVFASTQANAIPTGFGANASSPLGGYDLGGGVFATKFGLQATASFDGSTIAVSDINGLITSGSISAYYYASGNVVGGKFNNIVEFAPFTSDTVTATGGSNNKIFDSLYGVHTGNVVFTNGTGGTNTMGTGGNRITGNPFTQSVPEPSALVLLGIGLLGLGLSRKRAQM